MIEVIETESQRVARLNKEILADAKREPSRGLKLLGWKMSQEAFQQHQTEVQGYHPRFSHQVVVYFAPVTANRYSAHIINEHGYLTRLNIPEAGYRLHANYKDGYQTNGGNYSKIEHILDAMVYEVSKRWSEIALGEKFNRNLVRAELI